MREIEKLITKSIGLIILLVFVFIIPIFSEPLFPLNSFITTNILYTLPEEFNVKLSVYNLLEEKVITLVNTNQPAGHYTIKNDYYNL